MTATAFMESFPSETTGSRLQIYQLYNMAIGFTETAGDKGGLKLCCYACFAYACMRSCMSNCTVPKYMSSNLARAEEACCNLTWYRVHTQGIFAMSIQKRAKESLCSLKKTQDLKWCNSNQLKSRNHLSGTKYDYTTHRLESKAHFEPGKDSITLNKCN